MQGKVKWFSNERGFGFITSEEVKDDIFVHYSAIQMRGYRSLEKDELVEFEYIPEKQKAVNVIRLNPKFEETSDSSDE